LINYGTSKIDNNSPEISGANSRNKHKRNLINQLDHSIEQMLAVMKGTGGGWNGQIIAEELAGISSVTR
jgi:hypothetical protein